ncbi:MAG: hypothetical protein H7203_11745, partial [Rhizobacter sp.]|nr:hypothetical protein [Burkholderiales bacterium]
VRVKVVEVDILRKRIALTMRLDAPPVPAEERNARGNDRRGGAPFRQPAERQVVRPESAMAAAFAGLKRG